MKTEIMTYYHLSNEDLEKINEKRRNTLTESYRQLIESKSIKYGNSKE